MAKIINLDIDQGTNFSTTVVLQEANGAPVNLSGYTGEAQFRKHPGSNTAVEMIVSLGGNTGQVTVSLTAGQTANVEPGRYVYDIVLTSNTASVSKPVEGSLFLNGIITR